MSTRVTLAELNNRIRNALQDAFPETVWVVAEISELKENRTGHCYLELIEKDELTDEIKARARATIWSFSWRMIKPYFETTTGQQFTHGIKVLVQAAVEFHPAFGLSLNIKDIDPTYTVGDLVRRRREIVRQLVEAGVMQMNKELELPVVPQRIAVISSATAAGYQDFVSHLEANPHGFRFSHQLFEAFMQGSEAVSSILDALNRIFELESEFDAVVIIRGGGATADLTSFDNFDLAYAVAQFPLPVITGIGHEKDDTIVDLVAHTRMKTPTAAAEFFITGALRFYERLQEIEYQLTQIVRQILADQQEILSNLADEFTDSTKQYLQIMLTKLQKTGRRLQQSTLNYTSILREQLHNIRFRLLEKNNRFRNKRENWLKQLAFRVKYAALLKIEKSGIELDGKWTKIQNTTKLLLQSKQRKLENDYEKLRLLDPVNILQRGFTLTTQNGIILKSVKQISEQTELKTRFADGEVRSKIIKKQSYDNR